MTIEIDDSPRETDLESIRDLIGEMSLIIDGESRRRDLPFDFNVEGVIWDVAVGVLARHLGEYIIADPNRCVAPRPYSPHVLAKKYDLSLLPEKGQTPHQLAREIIQQMQAALDKNNLVFNADYKKLMEDLSESIFSRHIGLKLIDDSELPCSPYPLD